MRTLLCCFTVFVSAPQAPEEKLVDFPALGKAFIADHCDAKAASPCSLDEVLAKDFVNFSLGPFDLEIPHALLEDKGGLEFLREVVLPLTLQVQEWIAWQGATAQFPPETAAMVPQWAAAWKPASSAAIRKLASRDLLDVMPTSDAQRTLFKSLAAGCDDAARLAIVVPDGKQFTLILAPTRLDFMRWNGYGGLISEQSKTYNWYDDASQWTQFWLDWKLVLALEYASWNGFDPTFKASQPMKKVGKGILQQHVVQQATLALLRTTRPASEEGRFEGALAMLMAIDATGECNTIDGAGGVGTSGAKTRPYKKFVPGGNPKGGTLPARGSAAMSTITESRWRKGHGADGFVVPLKNGQQEGVKAAKGGDDVDPVATFVLHQEDNSGKHIVHAPFFGPHADEQEYPPLDYIVDYAEFYRAYKAGFFYWMEHTGVDPKNAAAKWTELVRGLKDVKSDEEFDAFATQVYGLPVSAKDGSTDSLEWRFLRSVAAAKTK